MLNQLLRPIFLWILSVRYRITVRGLDEIKARGRRGILFLPTHPALIDPIILGTVLLKDFQARPFADQDAVDLPGVRWIVRQVRGFIVPSVARYGQEASARIEALVGEVAQALRNGDNVILYPAGRTLRSHREVVSGTSAVESILRDVPDVRVVLVKTRGLWGSSFSYASGKPPDAGRILLDGLGNTLASFGAFVPKRPVDITFEEPADFPRVADRAVVNPYLERYYNQDAPPATYVPRSLWERGEVRELPDPEWGGVGGSLENVSATTREIVTRHLQEVTGAGTVRDTDQLAANLGMDSLLRADLLVWLESEFGFPQGNADSLQTVADVLLAASGEALAVTEDIVKPPPALWFLKEHGRRLRIAEDSTVPACFLAAARRDMGTAIVADAKSGVKTWRDLIMGILALLPSVRALPGERVGLMLPASVASCLTWLTIMFAGRTPVMVNWTVGRRNMLHGLDLTETKAVITAKPLVARLEKQGMDLEGLRERFVYLEDLAASVTRWGKLQAFFGGRLGLHALASAKISPVAAILFTSGSESLPKAVPLSHGNVLTNMRDVLDMVVVTGHDRMLAMLPPFHSFGLTANMVLPLTSGVRAVYHPNPTEGGFIAQTVEAYHATVVLATPTFVYGILRGGTCDQLSTLRLVVTGAEECPRRVYELADERCPKATLLEGYGITECSPVVSLSPPEAPRPHTIGRLLSSVEYALIDLETSQPVPAETDGMLLVRGPSIFGGYLGDAPNPFVEFEGRQWYRTGDLVRRSEEGVFTFAGRLKRFVKLGGEMISLPAVEAALQESLASPEDDGPCLAVVANAAEHPELVLFTTRHIDRETANARVRAAGLSSLYNLRRVEKVEAIPVLGTGKTDYRTLQSMLEPGG